MGGGCSASAEAPRSRHKRLRDHDRQLSRIPSTLADSLIGLTRVRGRGPQGHLSLVRKGGPCEACIAGCTRTGSREARSRRRRLRSGAGPAGGGGERRVHPARRRPRPRRRPRRAARPRGRAVTAGGAADRMGPPRPLHRWGHDEPAAPRWGGGGRPRGGGRRHRPRGERRAGALPHRRRRGRARRARPRRGGTGSTAPAGGRLPEAVDPDPLAQAAGGERGSAARRRGGRHPLPHPRPRQLQLAAVHPAAGAAGTGRRPG